MESSPVSICAFPRRCAGLAFKPGSQRLVCGTSLGSASSHSSKEGLGTGDHKRPCQMPPGLTLHPSSPWPQPCPAGDKAEDLSPGGRHRAVPPVKRPLPESPLMGATDGTRPEQPWVGDPRGSVMKQPPCSQLGRGLELGGRTPKLTDIVQLPGLQCTGPRPEHLLSSLCQVQGHPEGTWPRGFGHLLSGGHRCG